MELGGCIGILSCLVNARLALRSRHLVVEANPELIPWLKRHREINGAGFEIEQCAVSTRQEVSFAIHHYMTHGGVSARNATRIVQVRGRTLSDLHAGYGPFNVLLIDVEGDELEIFRASRDLLASYRLVIVEFHPETIGVEGVEECRYILGSSGLKCVARIQFSEAWRA
jgi:FkbM family methyltransferase